MNYSIVILFSFILLSTSCIKEDGEISTGGTVTTTGGGTGGGEVEVPGTPDPLASQAWHLENTGQTSFSSGTGVVGEDISLAAAITAGFTGDGVRIAVSDSGTDIDHNDLTGTQLVGLHRNYGISDSSQWRTTLPYVIGNDAHGTAVAGLIAAEGNNGLGSRGVAPDARYAAFRFIGDYSTTASSYLARSIDQADGDFDIFNYSYGYGQCAYTEIDDTLLDSYEYGVTNLRSGLGTNYVQSAGNSFTGEVGDCLGTSSTIDYIGNTNFSDDLTIPYKIVVGAINASGVKSSYSTPGSGIWISAPGGEYGDTSPAMLTTDISGCGSGYSRMTYALNEFNRGSALNTQCDYTSLMNGTSSAAPVLSGVIALMLQANPLLTWRDVKYILANTADSALLPDYDIAFPIPGSMSLVSLEHPLTPTWDAPLGFSYAFDYKWVMNAAGYNFSNWYGFGRVNAGAAVTAALGYTIGSLGTYIETDWADYVSTTPVIIPEEESNGTLAVDAGASTIVVADSLTIESIQIKVNITHADPSDVGIILVSPSGTESRVLHYNNLTTSVTIPADKVFLTNAFYGESSAGAWVIKVVDGDAEGDFGTLTDWSIKINGH